VETAGLLVFYLPLFFLCVLCGELFSSFSSLLLPSAFSATSAVRDPCIDFREPRRREVYG